MSNGPSSPTDAPHRRSLRARTAVGIGRTVAGASKLVRFGTGSVIGGRAALVIDRDLLAHLTDGREVVVVSATNGKTTTTRLLSVALGVDRPVVSNWLGANMTPGIVAALGPTPNTTTAVLEVDERWVTQVLADTDAAALVLLNLSRDQLDRTQEVRHLAASWREALDRNAPRIVIANADDPLVAWAAMAAPNVVWIATGQAWNGDAAGCPQCGDRIEFPDGGWACSGCDLRRPNPNVSIDGDRVHIDDLSVELHLALPGHVNVVNAAFALAAAHELGVDPTIAAPALGSVAEVAGRYRIAELDGERVRLLLAKNPAGWHEALEVVATSTGPLVVAINARIADGHDPSWLWDVEFERLAGRHVVAIGERRLDLAVRLAYAGVDHSIARDLDAALAEIHGRADHRPGTTIDIASNYTAFQEHLDMVGGVR